MEPKRVWRFSLPSTGTQEPDVALTITRNPDGSTHIESDGHVVLTGPIRGSVVLGDGSVVDVTAEAVEADSQEHAAEIAHAIGKHWEKVGHPDDFDIDDETGERVQRDFVYDAAHHEKHGRRAGKKD
jgi:hypothetical protein